eukprot:7872351-Pyramimonas_sp.AAC.1
MALKSARVFLRGLKAKRCLCAKPRVGRILASPPAVDPQRWVRNGEVAVVVAGVVRGVWRAGGGPASCEITLPQKESQESRI